MNNPSANLPIAFTDEFPSHEQNSDNKFEDLADLSPLRNTIPNESWSSLSSLMSEFSSDRSDNSHDHVSDEQSEDASLDEAFDSSSDQNASESTFATGCSVPISDNSHDHFSDEQSEDASFDEAFDLNSDQNASESTYATGCSVSIPSSKSSFDEVLDKEKTCLALDSSDIGSNDTKIETPICESNINKINGNLTLNDLTI